MRRTSVGLGFFLRIYLNCFRILVLTLAAASASGQSQAPINTRIPPPPPPPEESATPPPAQPQVQPAPAPALLPPAPDKVTLPTGTSLAVVLDTPLSTRISQDGQRVTFRTVDPVPVSDSLEIPPQTAITGTIVRVRRPGAFGKPGELRVKVDRIDLDGGSSLPIVARLGSPDADQQGCGNNLSKCEGRLRADSDRSADLYSIGMWALQGTLLGSQVKGGKGAAIGAGAGAAVALILLASRRGPDLYLEPGMPFTVVLDRDLILPGPELRAAQVAYQQTHSAGMGDEDSSASGSNPSAARGTRSGPQDGIPESQRPKLKRRPR